MMKRCKTQSPSNSRNQAESFEPIPLDLIIEILLRLPAKSTAKFRCVSKLWNSTIRSPNFTKSFLNISLSRPKLLFTCLKDDKMFFFSSQQPQNSSPLPVTRHMSFQVNYSSRNFRPVCGLVCGLNQKVFKGRRRVTTPLICNPSTGQVLSLPRVKTWRTRVFSYLGYDPIDKQFKVLCMTKSLALRPIIPNISQEHQVLTLEAGKKRLAWRKITCEIQHTPYMYAHDGVCINGVIYYLARVYVPKSSGYDVVCFDIRSEKFTFIKTVQGMKPKRSGKSGLVNYKGKLGMLLPSYDDSQKYKNIRLWVLEDAENHQWSSYMIFDLSLVRADWKSILKETKLRYVGMADTGEIVLSPTNILDSFYLVYLNTEKKTITRVEIKGMEAFKHEKVYAFLDHVDNLKLISNV